MRDKERFKDVRVGDRLWSSTKGWGEVEEIDMASSHPLRVFFQHRACPHTYTLEGFNLTTDKYPELHYDEIKFEEPEKPKRLVEKEVNVCLNLYNKSTNHYGSQISDEFNIIIHRSRKRAIDKAGDEVIHEAVPAKLTFKIME